LLVFFIKLETSCRLGSENNYIFALVYPHIIYGIENYANTCTTYLEPLMIINNKILRILQNQKKETPIKLLYKTYNTLPIPELFRMYITKFVYRVYYYKSELPPVFQDYYVLNESIHNYNTKQSSDLHPRVTNNKHGHNSISQLGSRIWNKLPRELKMFMSLGRLGKLIKNMYYDE